MPGRGLIISTRLDPDTSNRFVEFCERRQLDRSKFIRQLIEASLEEDAHLAQLMDPDPPGEFEVTVNFAAVKEEDNPS